MVTGPIPRKPNATSPKAKTAGAVIMASRPWPLIRYAALISATIAIPSQ